jgi:hypothetical protein
MWQFFCSNFKIIPAFYLATIWEGCSSGLWLKTELHAIKFQKGTQRTHESAFGNKCVQLIKCKRGSPPESVMFSKQKRPKLKFIAALLICSVWTLPALQHPFGACVLAPFWRTFSQLTPPFKVAPSHSLFKILGWRVHSHVSLALISTSLERAHNLSREREILCVAAVAVFVLRGVLLSWQAPLFCIDRPNPCGPFMNKESIISLSRSASYKFTCHRGTQNKGQLVNGYLGDCVFWHTARVSHTAAPLPVPARRKWWVKYCRY